MKNQVYSLKSGFLRAILSATLMIWIWGCGESNQGGGVIVAPTTINCPQLYPGSVRLDGYNFTPNDNGKWGDDEVGFVLSNWCTREIATAHLEKCGCVWTLDQAEVTASTEFCWGQDAEITIWRTTESGTWDSTFTASLYADGLTALSGIKVREGMNLSIDLPEGCTPDDLSLVMGGYHVVENIDGGDGGGRAKPAKAGL